MRRVGVIGCGWLGKPLAEELCKSLHVECFSRETTADNSSFWQSDTVVISINTKDNYLLTLQKIIKLTKPTCNIILMSSISVYREFDCDVDESAIITKTALQKEAEELILNSKENALILRLGGLMGDERISGKWKSVSTFTDGFVNYIHRDDVINITKKMIENDVRRGIYNVVAPLHPLRSKIHKKNSEDFGFILGSFEGMTKRRVLSQRLVKELNYTFLHPNPLEFWS
jgi:nucleoside-diphosphate-sugar epimerase